MGLDKKFLIENYRRQEDDELFYLLANEYNDLTEVAKEALAEELSARGFAEEVSRVITVHEAGLSPEQQEYYAALVRNLSCPHCNSDKERLNALMIKTREGDFYAVACPDCLSKIAGGSAGENILAASFGSFMSIINSVAVMISINDQLKIVRKGEDTAGFTKFIKTRVGQLELLKNNKYKLIRMLGNPEARVL